MVISNVFSKSVNYLLYVMLFNGITTAPLDTSKVDLAEALQISNDATPGFTTFNTPRFTLYIGDSGDSEITPKELSSIATKAIKALDKSYVEVNQLFGIELKDKVEVRLLSVEEFKSRTGAPEWTNAMYYRGEISIPVRRKYINNNEELFRTIKHEYIHAVTSKLTDYKCPAWIDEGIAQYFEGKENSLIAPALRKWTRKNSLVPLNTLKDGFMGFDSDVVPVIYGESLYVTKYLIDRYGMQNVTSFLKLIGEGKSDEEAFIQTFKLSYRDLETILGTKIKIWSEGNKKIMG